jgi:cytosine/adenosine deaminase-related metal-dependent hydrolase
VFLRGLFEQMPLDIWSFYSLPSNYWRLARADLHLRTTLRATECLLNGVTTCQDMPTLREPDILDTGEVIQAYERSGIRVLLAF